MLIMEGYQLVSTIVRIYRAKDTSWFGFAVQISICECRSEEEHLRKVLMPSDRDQHQNRKKQPLPELLITESRSLSFRVKNTASESESESASTQQDLKFRLLTFDRNFRGAM